MFHVIYDVSDMRSSFNSVLYSFNHRNRVYLNYNTTNASLNCKPNSTPKANASMTFVSYKPSSFTNKAAITHPWLSCTTIPIHEEAKWAFTIFSQIFQQNVSYLKLIRKMPLFWNSIFGTSNYSKCGLKFFFFNNFQFAITWLSKNRVSK